jgi:hypothetical protein
MQARSTPNHCRCCHTANPCCWSAHCCLARRQTAGRLVGQMLRSEVAAGGWNYRPHRVRRGNRPMCDAHLAPLLGRTEPEIDTALDLVALLRHQAPRHRAGDPALWTSSDVLQPESRWSVDARPRRRGRRPQRCAGHRLPRPTTDEPTDPARCRCRHEPFGDPCSAGTKTRRKVPPVGRAGARVGTGINRPPRTPAAALPFVQTVPSPPRPSAPGSSPPGSCRVLPKRSWRPTPGRGAQLPSRCE